MSNLKQLKASPQCGSDGPIRNNLDAEPANHDFSRTRKFSLKAGFGYSIGPERGLSVEDFGSEFPADFIF